MSEKDLETRIRSRAHRIWKDEGCPEGREKEHWELAKFAIAQEDAQSSMLQPIDQPETEPLEVVINQGEFPTLTDQGEQQDPKPRSAG
jgi:hypothetical protein